MLDDAITADMVGLYPSIPHPAGVNSLKEALENRINKQILTSGSVKTAEFFVCNNYFEFSEVFQQILGTATSTKFAPPYSCIYMQTWMGKASIALVHAILKIVVWYIARLKHCLMFHSFSTLLNALFSMTLIKCSGGN